MTTSARRSIGARIAATRTARRMTQGQLARAAQLSVSLVQKIEQGRRVATDSTLTALGAALRCDVDQLTGHATPPRSKLDHVVPDLRRALDAIDLPDDHTTRGLEQLAHAVKLAERHRLTSRYVDAAALLPAVVEDLAVLRQQTRQADAERVSRLLVSALRSLDAVAYKAGYHDLAARIVDRMCTLSADLGDDALTASTAYVRTETYFATGDLTRALVALESAIRATGSSATTHVAAVGALHMRAAVVAGRLGRADTARAHLREADTAARHAPEAVYLGTAFGPHSVQIHRLAVAVELRDAEAALHLADTWTPPPRLPAERRSHFYVDLARAALWGGRLERAFNALQTARRIAPQHIRSHPQVRETVFELLTLRRSPGDDVISFSNWVVAT